MKRMQAYYDFRTRLLTADKYFGIAPAHRSRCVEFLVALSGFEASPAPEPQDASLLQDRFHAAVHEARGLIEANELDAMELPLLEGASSSQRAEPLEQLAPQIQSNAPDLQVDIAVEAQAEPVAEFQSEPAVDFSLELEPSQEPEPDPGFSIELPPVPDPISDMQTILPPRAGRLVARAAVGERAASARDPVETDLDAWELVATLAD